MAIVQVQELIEAGVHYGHRSSRWNPKMRPYIYGKRNLIHIIDLRETLRGLIRAHRFLNRVSAQGSLILYVGTKRQAQEAIVREAHRVSMPFVSERWIGGMFTNFRTVRNRLQRLEELERIFSSGEIHSYSKKMRSTLLREMKKIHRNLHGIRTMNRLPGALIVVDPCRESSAIREARRVGIPIVSLIDTDSDPDLVDLAIPGNDDSIRSIDLVLQKLTDAVKEGLGSLPRDQVEKLENDYTKAHSGITPEQALAIIQSGEAAKRVVETGAAVPAAPESPTSVSDLTLGSSAPNVPEHQPAPTAAEHA